MVTSGKKSRNYLQFFYVLIFSLGVHGAAVFADSEQDASMPEYIVQQQAEKNVAAPSVALEQAPAVLSPGRVLGQVVLGLTLVSILILVLAWFAKRMGYGSLTANGSMRVLGNLPLGNREKAVLVVVNGKQLLLGVTPNTVNCLHEFDVSEFPTNNIDSAKPDAEKTNQDFSGYLKTILTQGSK